MVRLSSLGGWKKNSFNHPCSSHKIFLHLHWACADVRHLHAKCCCAVLKAEASIDEDLIWTVGFSPPRLIWNSTAQAGAAYTVKRIVLWNLYIIQLWRSWATASFLFSSLQQMNVVHHTVWLQIGSHHCCDASTDWSKGRAGMDWGGSQAGVLTFWGGRSAMKRAEKREKGGEQRWSLALFALPSCHSCPEPLSSSRATVPTL